MVLISLPSGEDRHQGRVLPDKRHLVRDEVADNRSAVLLAERLEIWTDDRGRDTEFASETLKPWALSSRAATCR